VIVVGLLLVVLGLGFGVGGWRVSNSDYAWNHRNSRWRTGVNVSDNRATQTLVWKSASVILGVALIVLGIVAVAAGLNV
jgi:hypothetical protein